MKAPEKINNGVILGHIPNLELIIHVARRIDPIGGYRVLCMSEEQSVLQREGKGEDYSQRREIRTRCGCHSPPEWEKVRPVRGAVSG